MLFSLPSCLRQRKAADRCGNAPGFTAYLFGMSSSCSSQQAQSFLVSLRVKRNGCNHAANSL